MTKTNPLLLPEIQTHLGQFLTKKSLLCCILVCREWHDALYPSLWLDTRIHPSFGNPDLPPDLILKNSHYIRRIALSHMVHPQLKEMHLSQLKRVILFAMTAKQRDLALWSEQFLLRHRTTLVSMNALLDFRTIHYTSDYDTAMNRTTTMAPGWDVLKELYRLHHLFLMNGRVQPHSWDDCWQTWCQLNFLGLKGVSFEPTVRSNHHPLGFGAMPNPWVPPFAQIRNDGLHLRNNVRQLELWSLSNMTSVHQLELILCFPKLERLAWTVGSASGPLPLKEFAIAIADEGCSPLLTNIELDDAGKMQDKDLAHLLSVMKVITGVQVTKAGFGPLSLRALLGDEGDTVEQTGPEAPASNDGGDGVATVKAEIAPPLPPRLDKDILKNMIHHIEVIGYDFDSNKEEGEEQGRLPGEQDTLTGAVRSAAIDNDDAGKETKPCLPRGGHAETLVFFKMALCPTVTSAMLHRVLCSCPNLKQVTGAVICDADMFTEAILPSDEFRPWKCVKLKKLQCFFEVHDEVRNRQVLQALGSLTQLDILKTKFSHEQIAVQADNTHCLTFSLKSGLGELKSLKLLSEWWSEGQIDLEIDEDEVDWIADNLQNLSLFYGRVAMDYYKSLELKKKFASRGIKTA